MKNVVHPSLVVYCLSKYYKCFAISMNSIFVTLVDDEIMSNGEEATHSRRLLICYQQWTKFQFNVVVSLFFFCWFVNIFKRHAWVSSINPFSVTADFRAMWYSAPWNFTFSSHFNIQFNINQNVAERRRTFVLLWRQQRVNVAETFLGKKENMWNCAGCVKSWNSFLSWSLKL